MVLWRTVSPKHCPDRPGGPGFDAEKNNNFKNPSSNSNHREARSDNSHFLPFTRNPKADSGGRARQNRYFFVAPLLAFPLKKLRIVALYLLSSSRNLPLRSIGVSFFCFENTLKPASSF